VRLLVSNSIYAKKDGNGIPSDNLVASRDEPRHGHTVYILQVQPPTSPNPAQRTLLEVTRRIYISAMGPKELNVGVL